MHVDNLSIDSGVHGPDFLELVWQWSEQHSEAQGHFMSCGAFLSEDVTGREDRTGLRIEPAHWWALPLAASATRVSRYFFRVLLLDCS